jgi:transcriptional adapter 2-alpha
MTNTGVDRELLLIEGLMSHGLGNWSAAAEHVGTRTKEEVKTHYEQVYHDSDTWPLPVRARPTVLFPYQLT